MALANTLFSLYCTAPNSLMPVCSHHSAQLAPGRCSLVLDKSLSTRGDRDAPAQQWQPASPKGLQSRRITPSPFAEVKGNGSFPGAGACVLPPGSGAGKGGIPGLPLGLRAAPTAPLLQKGTWGQSWHKAGCKGDFGVQM